MKYIPEEDSTVGRTESFRVDSTHIVYNINMDQRGSARVAKAASQKRKCSTWLFRRTIENFVYLTTFAEPMIGLC
jgi:hypothetical protein